MHGHLKFAGTVAVLVPVVLLGGCSGPPVPTGTTTVVTSATTTESALAQPASTAARPSAPSTISSSSSAGPTASSTPTAPAEVIDTPPTTSTAAAPPPPPTSSPATGFVSTISDIDPETAARMSASWRPGCPVELSDLSYLTVSYRGFDGSDHQGELVVASAVATTVVDIFGDLYDAGYPIASLRLVDDFGGSDDDSMAADNSSAFNCRPITGGGGFSEHSYGTAIDLNPVQNPYLSGSLVLPEQGRPFVDRQPAPGVIRPGDAVVTAFADHGWTWGGSWDGPVDYQHFSISGH